MTDSIASLLLAAVTKHLKKLQLYHANHLITDMARKNDKRPAYIQMGVLDDVVKNIGGDPKLLDEYILVRIPADVRDSEIAEALEALEKEAMDAESVADAAAAQTRVVTDEEVIGEVASLA